MALKISGDVRARITRRHWTRFWGQRRLCRPMFIEAALGNGMKLLSFTSCDTRPNYYLIRVDSRWHDENYKQPCVAEHLGEILDAIAAECGEAHEEWQADNGRTYRRWNKWPALNMGSETCNWVTLEICSKS